MARPCSICSRNDRNEIDNALVSREGSLTTLADRYCVTRSSLTRHSQRHLSPSLVALQADEDRAKARTTLERMERQYELLSAVVESARRDGQTSTILAAAREMRQTAELLARITGELNDRPQVVVNLMASREWLTVRSTILAALVAHPEARRAVSASLLQLEA